MWKKQFYSYPIQIITIETKSSMDIVEEKNLTNTSESFLKNINITKDCNKQYLNFFYKKKVERDLGFG